jgi:alpha-glucosidase
LGYNHNQADVIQYAKTMKANGVPPGVIMIDDTWQEAYGTWDFHAKNFSNPKAMMDELHAMGYKVMLWICPFVSPDSKPYRELLKSGGLVLDSTGSKPKMTEWWNGVSAVLDLSHPEGKKWFDEQLEYLVNEYGVDGFKFDAGDPQFYRNGAFHEDISMLEQCRLFNEYGLKYPLNEFRTTWKMGGEPLAQRLCDKGHEWVHLQQLIPHILVNGLMGHAFTCPDMIGGGDINNFNMGNIDEELIVRSTQVHALMPMMQFSLNPYRVLSLENQQRITAAIQLREKYVPYIMELVKHAANTGEPIVRMMEYEFPGEGLEHCKEQFMLGDKYLVAPVVQKEQIVKEVFLPKGSWKDEKGEVWEGGKKIEIEADLSRIPVFEKN